MTRAILRPLAAPAKNDRPAEPARVRPATTKQMRAMVHPLRMRILDALRTDGPSTASRLAVALGESSGATSYHLRVLADAGVIEELPERGSGRERWWRRTTPLYMPTDAEDPAGRAVELAARAMHLDREEEASRRFVDHYDDLPVEWRRASFTGTTVAYLTPDELLAFGLEYLERIEQLGQREGPRPPDARRVIVALRGIPWIDVDD
jgi:DNA-binding transcriptional ArsR family regulator